MLRFKDPCLLKWNTTNNKNYENILVIIAGGTISRTTIINSKYYEYILETGNADPKNLENGKFSYGENSFSVNYISYNNVLNYCKWLS